MIPRALFLLLLFFVIASSASHEQKTYIVHVDKTKIAQEHNSGTSMQWYEALIESITKPSYTEDETLDGQTSSTSPQVIYVYESAVTGFAARLSPKQIESLQNTDGVVSILNDELLTLHTTHSPKFLGLQTGRGLWNVTNAASDVILGILDTGIWPEHASFQDSGMPPVPSRWKGACEEGTNFTSSNCNKKIIGARAFFKGYEAVVGRIVETSDYRSPRDKQGHGTHTASTAAGNYVKKANMFGLAKGNAAGMKYTGRIAVYKVCWRLGCATSDILAAMDRAIEDGVDVLSLSLGGLSRPYYMDSIAIASFRAIEKGIFVSCSAGNSGPTPSTVGNVAPWIMTVAASYMDRSFPTKVKLGNGKIYEGATLYSGRSTKLLPLVYGKTAGLQTAEFCVPDTLDSRLVSGKIVVCDRGINSRTDKGEQVRLAGGAGMILLNTERDGEELFADAHVLPATMLGAKAATSIKTYLNTTKNPMASISFRGTVYGNPAPVVAAFSSRGPSFVGPDVIKPDVIAPGVNILAAWPPVTAPSLLRSDNRSVKFNIISGTSMSCPHVSGLGMLIRSAHRDWSAAAIKSALMTTAYTLDSRRLPIVDTASSFGVAEPFAFGSGHVDPERAADPGLIYDISGRDYLNYLCKLGYNSTQIALFGGSSFTCPKSGKSQPGKLNYPSFAVLFNIDSRKSSFTFKRTVTNVGSPMSTYKVVSDEPDGVLVMVAPRTLSFTKLGQKQNYKVTFSYQKGKAGPGLGSGNSSFGSITWVSGRYIVRSPIAVTWS